MTRRIIGAACAAALMLAAPPAAAEEQSVELSPDWEYVADAVMGGMSTGGIRSEIVDGRAAMRLTGQVSLENDGGFIQMAFDMAEDGGAFDASGWTGIELELRGNAEPYELRLRTDELTRPWQSFRAPLDAPPTWTRQRVPFSALEPHRTDATFDPSRLRRVGVVAIGKEFTADVAVAAIRLYR